MSEATDSDIVASIQQIPSGLFILTSAHAGMRSGVLTKWVQPCSESPPHVMVAIARGLPVEPLVRDSRSFALCQISEGDRLLMRTFAEPPERGDDPFIALAASRAASGSPIVDRALAYLDCELVRHIVLDADHRLYVGLVRAGGLMNSDSRPAIAFGTNGRISSTVDLSRLPHHDNGAADA